MRLLSSTSARAAALREALLHAADSLGELSDAAAARARAILAPALAMRGSTPALTISAVGHAHMDLAWLWPIRETIRKCGRTFATVLHMMERYPGYVFGASQPQQYDWVKRHYPELYAAIKRRVAEGRWEIQGAMWVEPDTNLPGGDSAVGSHAAPSLEPRQRPDGQLLEAEHVRAIRARQPDHVLEEVASSRRHRVPVEDVPGADEERQRAH